MSGELTSSLHTHSLYCDGESSIEEMVVAAIDAGLSQVGISSHAPLPFDSSWNMRLERLPEYIREVEELRRRYAGRITVSLALEVDFVPDQRVARFQDREIFSGPFEYFIGSVHFLGMGYPPRSYEASPATFRGILREEYGNDIRAMVGDYYQRVRAMLELPWVAIVGHLDRIKRWNTDRELWRDDEPWYREAVEETLVAVARSGKVLELNTSGWRKGQGEPYPAPWILARCAEYGIPVLVTADAHVPHEVVDGFDRAAECLAEVGIVPRRTVL